MGRKRTACEFCENEIIESQDDGRHQLCLEMYPEINSISIYSFADNDGEYSELTFQIPMNFCPNCGRRLT